MKLRALRVRNVGPFGEDGCALENLSDGLNVIRERNEAGKSTLFTALQMVLFEKHSSRKAAIQDFRHDRGSGAPHIEVDIELDGRTYRIAKQYLSSASAVVLDAVSGERVHEKSEAENWIVRSMGGDRPENGPSGLLWVRQGDPLVQPRPEGGAGDALFSLLEGEVDAVTGGKRAARVLERAQARLADIVTAKKMTPSGRFKQAHERCDELEAERAEHAAALRRSQDDRERLVTVVSSIESMTEEDDARIKQELKDAERDLETAEGAAQTLQALENEVSSLDERVAAAETVLKRLEDDLGQVETLTRSLKTLREKRAEALDAIADQDKAVAEHVKEADAATAVLDDAKSAYKAALKREQARRDASRRTDLERDLVRAKALLEEKRDAEKRAAEPLPALTDLEDAAQQALEVEAEARASRPVLTVARSGAPVLLDGDPIGSDPVRLSGAASITYQDLELKIDAPDAQGVERRLAAAKDRLDDLLDQCGVKSVAAARVRHQERDAARETAKRLAQDLADLAPDGLSTLEAALGDLPEAELAPEEQHDLDALAAALETAEQAEARARGGLESARNARSDSGKALAVIETRVDAAQIQLSELEAALGDDTERKDSLAELTKRVKAAGVRRDEAQQKLEAARRELPSLEGAKARVKRLEQAQANRSQERVRLIQEEAALRARLDQAGQSGAAEKLAAAEAEIRKWRERIALFEVERDALALLIEQLVKARASRRNAFFAPVRKEVDPLLSMVLGSAALGYDDALGPDELERKGRTEKLSRLSGGTQEQVAVLTRLGFARVMAAKGRHMPIVLDDALVYSDDDRIQKLFDAINLVADDVQILAFSCRQKAFEALGGHTVHPIAFAG
ncbi:MAG: AAA family ATPase [Oceanicaulis sp.]